MTEYSTDMTERNAGMLLPTASRTVASLVELASYSFSGSRATSDTGPM